MHGEDILTVVMSTHLGLLSNLLQCHPVSILLLGQGGHYPPECSNILIV